MRSQSFSTLAVVQAAAAQPAGDGVWVKRKDGSSYHLQSGFSCPQMFLGYVHQPSEVAISVVTLRTVIVGSERQPPGSQVGCEYENAEGAWATLEIAKLDPGESPSDHADATRKRIQERYPDAARIPGNWPPDNPAGGKGYGIRCANIRAADRTGSLIVVGGDVEGWMITVIQFDYDMAGIGLHAAAEANWTEIAGSRKQP